MADRPHSVTRLAPYGWVTVLAGAADLIRIIPEALGIPRANSLYGALVGGDVTAGILAIAAGTAVARGRRRGPGAACLAWGYFLGNSSGMLWFIGWFHLVYRGKLPTLEDRQFQLLVPRIVFYVLSASAAPFLLGMLVTRGAARGERTTLLQRLACGLAVGAATAALFVYRRLT